ncbi:MAG TPA: hypothetical protein VFL85_02705 [Candidatus Saccharimonadales bacterium]|nr:hypothetical protein [Candidatus Saccharimonadales bacterium]
MFPNQPQGFNSFELANTPHSGIGEASQNRLQVVQKAVYNGFAGLAQQLPPAPQSSETYPQHTATQPMQESVATNPSPVYPAENYEQQLTAQPVGEADFLKPEDLRNNIDRIHAEIDAERRYYQQTSPAPATRESQDNYGLTA